MQHPNTVDRTIEIPGPEEWCTLDVKRTSLMHVFVPELHPLREHGLRGPTYKQVVPASTHHRQRAEEHGFDIERCGTAMFGPGPNVLHFEEYVSAVEWLHTKGNQSRRSNAWLQRYLTETLVPLGPSTVEHTLMCCESLDEALKLAYGCGDIWQAIVWARNDWRSDVRKILNDQIAELRAKGAKYVSPNHGPNLRGGATW